MFGSGCCVVAVVVGYAWLVVVTVSLAFSKQARPCRIDDVMVGGGGFVTGTM